MVGGWWGGGGALPTSLQLDLFLFFFSLDFHSGVEFMVEKSEILPIMEKKLLLKGISISHAFRRKDL